MSDINELAAALAKAHQSFGKIARDKEVSVTSKRTGARYTFKYAPLESIMSAVRRPLADNGIALFQTIVMVEGRQFIETRLIHSSGQSMSSMTPIIASGEGGPQEWGSACSYARRYGVTTTLCLVADEDDDANIAEGNEVKPSAKISPLDHGETVSPRQASFAKEFADGFRKLLAADVEEAEKAEKIRALRDEANEDPIVAQEAWKLLTAAERRTIKTYISMKVAA